MTAVSPFRESPLKVWSERDGKLLRLRLARPKANLIDAEMIAALDHALAENQANASLLAVLLDHEGPHFSFGASVEEHLPGQCADMLRSFHSLVMRLLATPVPVMVAIDGQCLGGGLEVALSDPANQTALAGHFPSSKLAVADTMDLWIDDAYTELLQMLTCVDGLVLNDSEAEQLTEINNAVSAARKILDMGPTFVVVKKGEHGAVLVHRDGLATIPAYPSGHHQVVDPTGAGDAFAGGMMGHIAAVGMTDFASIQTALAWGTVTASFAIESFGLTRLTEISRSDIDERMREFQGLARVG